MLYADGNQVSMYEQCWLFDFFPFKILYRLWIYFPGFTYGRTADFTKEGFLICLNRFLNKIIFKSKIQKKTREKRFEWDPWATALIMSAPDLAFMITVVPIEKIIRPMDRGRVLGLRIVFKLKPIYWIL